MVRLWLFRLVAFIRGVPYMPTQASQKPACAIAGMDLLPHLTLLVGLRGGV